MRSGPPEPPAIFIGRATIQKPLAGRASRFARFSRPGTFAPLATWWTMKSVDGPWSMDAVSTPSAEVKARCLARRVVPQVALPVGPAGRPARAQEHDRAGRDRAVALLPRPHVRGAQPVVRVRGGRLRNIQDDARRDELRERDLVGGETLLREVRWRVEVRAAVLGRAERVRAVVVAALRPAVGELRELESRGRVGPVDRLLIEDVRQVHDLRSGQVEPDGGGAGSLALPNRRCEKGEHDRHRKQDSEASGRIHGGSSLAMILVAAGPRAASAPRPNIATSGVGIVPSRVNIVTETLGRVLRRSGPGQRERPRVVE